MEYCTENDLTQRYGVKKIAQLTGDPAGAAVDSAKVAALIADVGSLIDAYVGKQYALPFDPAEVPSFLRSLAVEEVYYGLKESAPAGTGGVSDALFRQHEARIRTLRDIAQGKITLGLMDGASGERITRPRPEEPFRVKTRIFGREA